MPIVKALLKYGQNNFAVLIVEYVELNKLAIRETHFISKLLPYYNVLKQAYSSVGYKHTEDIKQMLTELAKNRVHSDLTKSLISKALLGENNPFYNKSHSPSPIAVVALSNKALTNLIQSFNHSTLAFDHSNLNAKSRATLARPAGLGRPAGEACVRLPEATEEDLNGFKWR